MCRKLGDLVGKLKIVVSTVVVLEILEDGCGIYPGGCSERERSVSNLGELFSLIKLD